MGVCTVCLRIMTCWHLSASGHSFTRPSACNSSVCFGQMISLCLRPEGSSQQHEQLRVVCQETGDAVAYVRPPPSASPVWIDLGFCFLFAPSLYILLQIQFPLSFICTSVQPSWWSPGSALLSISGTTAESRLAATTGISACWGQAFSG